MPDYGREIQFGSFLFPTASKADDLLRQAQAAEELGFDIIGVPDHPPWPQFLDQWTLLSAVATSTERIHLFSDVVNFSLRTPALVAKAAWSLDALAPGRLHLGLGAGWDWDATASFGGARRGPAEALERLTEAVEVVRLLLSGEPTVSFEGRHFRLEDAKPPSPARPIDIWIGSGKPRMRRLTARVANGWIPNGDGIVLDNLTECSRHLDEEIVAAGRHPSELRRICQTLSYETSVKAIQPKSEGFLCGPASQWVEELTHLALELGIDTFVFGDPDDPVGHLRRVIEEIAPGVRENVAASRAREGTAAPAA